MPRRINLHYNATMLRRLILVLSLITAFGLGQQGAVVHAISHLADEQSQQHKLPHSDACEKCVVYAQLGTAIGVENTLLALADQQQPVSFEYGVRRTSQYTFHYAARAPPVLS